MAGLLKAIENGYKPTALDIANELKQIPQRPGETERGYAKNGAYCQEEFISRLLKLLFLSNLALLKSRTTGIL